jgi:hypothetical protein
VCGLLPGLVGPVGVASGSYLRFDRGAALVVGVEVKVLAASLTSFEVRVEVLATSLASFGVRVEVLATSLAGFEVRVEVLTGAFARLGNRSSSSGLFDLLLAMLRLL